MSNLTSKQITTLFIVLFIALSSMFGIDIHLASLPYIANAMNTDKQHIQQSISIFLLGMGLSLLIYGPLSDKYGRKPIVIIGLLIAALASFAGSFSLNINTFLYWRFLSGIGFGVGMGIGRTIFADILSGEILAMVGSYFSTIMSVSPLFAPMFGGYLQHIFGWQSNFIVLGIFCLILVIAFVIFCPETNLHKNHKLSVHSMYKNYIFLLHHPTFICATLLTGISMASIMVYATTSSFILEREFDLTPIMYGWITMVAGGGAFFGKIIGPSVIKRITSLKIIRVGLYAILIAGSLLALFILLNSINVAIIMLAVFVAYTGNGFIMPSVSAQALGRFHDKRGTAGALFGAFQMLLAAFGSSIVGMLPYKGTHLLASSYLILGVLGLIVYHILAKSLKQS